MRLCLTRAAIFTVTVLATNNLAGRAEAAPVSWGTPQNIAGDADVDTTGTFLSAVNLGLIFISPPPLTPAAPPNTTVNGVLFTGVFANQPNPNTAFGFGNFSFSSTDPVIAGNTGSLVAAPFSALSPAYQALLQTVAVGSTATSTLTLTLSGLTISRQYELEWWSSDGFTSFQTLTTAAATNSVTLNSNTIAATGGVGQFAIGTFIADANTEVVTFVGNGTTPALIDGAQLRDITPTTNASEPSTLALFGVGLAGFGPLRRKRRG